MCMYYIYFSSFITYLPSKSLLPCYLSSRLSCTRAGGLIYYLNCILSPLNLYSPPYFFILYTIFFKIPTHRRKTLNSSEKRKGIRRKKIRVVQLRKMNTLAHNQLETTLGIGEGYQNLPFTLRFIYFILFF